MVVGRAAALFLFLLAVEPSLAGVAAARAAGAMGVDDSFGSALQLAQNVTTVGSFPSTLNIDVAYYQFLFPVIAATLALFVFIFFYPIKDALTMKWSCPCKPEVKGYQTWHAYHRSGTEMPVVIFDVSRVFNLDGNQSGCRESNKIKGYRVADITYSDTQYDFLVEPGDYVIMANCQTFLPKASDVCDKGDRDCICGRVRKWNTKFQKEYSDTMSAYHMVILRKDAAVTDNEEVEDELVSCPTADWKNLTINEEAGRELPASYGGIYRPLQISVISIAGIAMAGYLGVWSHHSKIHRAALYLIPGIILALMIVNFVIGVVQSARGQKKFYHSQGFLNFTCLGFVLIVFFAAALFDLGKITSDNSYDLVATRTGMAFSWLSMLLNLVYLVYIAWIKWRHSTGSRDGVQFDEESAGIVLGIAAALTSGQELVEDSRAAHANGGTCDVQKLVRAVQLAGPTELHTNWGGTWGVTNVDCSVSDPAHSGVIPTGLSCDVACSDTLTKRVECAHWGFAGAEWSVVYAGEEAAKTMCCDYRPCPQGSYQSAECTAATQRVCTPCSADNCNNTTQTYIPNTCGGLNSGCAPVAVPDSLSHS